MTADRLSPQREAEIDPFWVEQRAQSLAAKSTSADPSACGTCRSLVEVGEPVEHDECAQRATLLQAPDHPHYEILAGFSLEENAKLPARFHIPVFDDLGQPNLWHCAVCWEDGTVVQWPCKTAMEQGSKVFSPQHEAETAQKKLLAELAAVRKERDEALAEVSELKRTVDYFDQQSKRRKTERDEARAEVTRMTLAEVELCSWCGHVEAAHSKDGSVDCNASGAEVAQMYQCPCTFFIPGGAA